jgi:hypothetical protein
MTDEFSLPKTTKMAKCLGGPRRKYGGVSDEEFLVQARREEGADPQRSVANEQRSLRRKGPSGTSPYLRLGPLSEHQGTWSLLRAVKLYKIISDL